MKRVFSLGNSGFSIIELMTTLAILAMLSMVIITFMIQTDNSMTRTEARLAATTKMYEKYQEYETKTFTSLTAGTATNSYEVEDFTSSLPPELLPPRSAKVFIRNITP